MSNRAGIQAPEELAMVSKQLAILQEYITLKFGSEFEDFYRSRLQQNIHQNQGLYDNGGVAIKEEQVGFGHLVGANNQLHNQQVYYSFQNPDGAGAFTFSNPNVQLGSIIQSPSTVASPESGLSSAASKKAHKAKLRLESRIKTTVKNVSLNLQEVSHECPIRGCKKSYKRLNLLHDHVRVQHENRLTCATVGCNLPFPDKAQLQHHELRCLVKPQKCKWEGCDKTFRTSKLLHGHISAVHRRPIRAILKCSIPECDKLFPDAIKLKLHENRCRFKYEYNANPDFGLEDETPPSVVATQAATTSSAYSDADGIGGGPFQTSINPVTVDMGSFFIKTEAPEEQCCVTQT